MIVPFVLFFVSDFQPDFGIIFGIPGALPLVKIFQPFRLEVTHILTYLKLFVALSGLQPDGVCRSFWTWGVAPWFGMSAFQAENWKIQVLANNLFDTGLFSG